MKLKYSPQESSNPKPITIIDDNTIQVGAETYTFPPTITQFDASGPILEAHRDATGELYLTVLRTYRHGDSLAWDTGAYQ